MSILSRGEVSKKMGNQLEKTGVICVEIDLQKGENQQRIVIKSQEELIEEGKEGTLDLDF